MSPHRMQNHESDIKFVQGEWTDVHIIRDAIGRPQSHSKLTPAERMMQDILDIRTARQEIRQDRLETQGRYLVDEGKKRPKRRRPIRALAAVALLSTTIAGGAVAMQSKRVNKFVTKDAPSFVLVDILGGDPDVYGIPEPEKKPTLAVTEPEEKPKPSIPLADCVPTLPLDLRTGQLIMAGVNGYNLTKARPILDKYHIGGVEIKGSDNSVKIHRVFRVKNVDLIPRLIASPEEGGSVQTMKQLGILPSQKVMAETNSSDAARQAIEQYGAKLKEFGIDVVFGPNANVGPKQGIGPMKDRVFSNDPAKVTEYTAQVAQGWINSGIMPVLRHFPGEGHASGNTYFGPAHAAGINALRNYDFAPYNYLKGNNSIGVMVGHVTVPEYGAAPASVNPQIINQVLRYELGFPTNLVFSDAINKKGLGLPLDQAVEQTIVAGTDIALFEGSQDLAAMDNEMKTMQTALQNAVTTGRLPEQILNDKVERILDRKGYNPCNVPG